MYLGDDSPMVHCSVAFCYVCFRSQSRPVWDNCRLIQNQAPAIVSWALSYCPFSISKKEVFVCLSAVISTALVVDISDLVIHYIEET